MQIDEKLLGIKQRFAVGAPWWNMIDKQDIQFLLSTIEGLKKRLAEVEDESANMSIRHAAECEGLKGEVEREVEYRNQIVKIAEIRINTRQAEIERYRTALEKIKQLNGYMSNYSEIDKIIQAVIGES